MPLKPIVTLNPITITTKKVLKKGPKIRDLKSRSKIRDLMRLLISSISFFFSFQIYFKIKRPREVGKC